MFLMRALPCLDQMVSTIHILFFLVSTTTNILKISFADVSPELSSSTLLDFSHCVTKLVIKFHALIFTIFFSYFFSAGFVNGVTPGNVGLSFNINV